MNSSRFNRCVVVIVVGLMVSSAAAGGEQIIDGDMHHLRAGGESPQWADFPEQPDGQQLTVTFQAETNETEYTLWLRQYQLRHLWRLTINGENLGRMPRDERDMTIAWTLPAGTLVNGKNTLTVESTRAPYSDDLLVGQIRVDPRPRDTVLNEAQLSVTVTDADNGTPLPSRLTIVDEHGSLVSLGAESDDQRAVRPGTVYTLTGETTFGLPPGEYTVYAGRGTEYSLATEQISIAAGEQAELALTLRHELRLPGYVSSDTHLHTVTHSGHGDATITERMITIVGEGLQMPIATDHNINVDYTEEARRVGADRYFTSVIGNEVTTRIGHFNIFPIDPSAPEPDAELETWSELFDEMNRVPGVKVVVLDHARDFHQGFRPLGPENFIAASGRRLDGRELKANAMEVINSGATRSDPLEYVHDWLAMLNRGHHIVPAGGSDSHDVARKFAGQARTYVAYDGDDVSDIDVRAASRNFAAGRVLVSFGLLADIRVNNDGRPGDRIAADGEIEVDVTVLGPSWLLAERVLLYANGVPVREATIDSSAADKVEKFTTTWTLDAPTQDLHLVAVAIGPGTGRMQPYWKVSRPYQASSTRWEPYVLGISGAVYVNADGEEWISPHQHARQLVQAHLHELDQLVAALDEYDHATAVQAACVLDEHDTPPDDPALQAALERASAKVRQGFATFKTAWQASREARREVLEEMPR